MHGGTPRRGFTMIELIVVLAIAGILLGLAAPRLSDYLLVQRLKGIHSQLVTDLQFGRSEAVAKNIAARFVFRTDDSTTCYTIFTVPPGSDASLRCDCLLGAGAACSGGAAELRTHAVPRSSGVRFAIADGVDPAFAIDHMSGGLLAIPTTTDPSPLAAFVVETVIDGGRALRTTIGQTGRVTYCGTSTALGATTC
jgi:prepilin-type N-terminal cleavage/methylation domain-containing protein